MTMDLNHDGELDVNEIGRSLEYHYKTDPLLRGDQRIWGCLSRADWIPMNVLNEQIQQGGCVTKEVADRIISDINPENNPNCTFWQVLRSRMTPGVRDLWNMVANSGSLYTEVNPPSLRSIPNQSMVPSHQTDESYILTQPILPSSSVEHLTSKQLSFSTSRSRSPLPKQRVMGVEESPISSHLARPKKAKKGYLLDIEQMIEKRKKRHLEIKEIEGRIKTMKEVGDAQDEVREVEDEIDEVRRRKRVAEEMLRAERMELRECEQNFQITQEKVKLVKEKAQQLEMQLRSSEEEVQRLKRIEKEQQLEIEMLKERQRKVEDLIQEERELLQTNQNKLLEEKEITQNFKIQQQQEQARKLSQQRQLIIEQESSDALEHEQRSLQNNPKNTKNHKEKVIKKTKSIPTLAEVVNLRIPLGLNKIDSRRMADHLSKLMKNKKYINQEQFIQLMKQFIPSGLNPQEYLNCCKTLFSFLDYNGDKMLDKTEVSNTLIMLSNGDKAEKAEACFRFYDSDRNGTLSLEELTSYFTGLFKLKSRDSNIDAEQLQVMAAATAKKAFSDIDSDNNGTISIKEFREWIIRGGSPSMSLKKPSLIDFKQIEINENDQINKVKDLIQKIRKGIPFERIHISVALHELSKLSQDLKSINKMTFKTLISDLVSKVKLNPKFKDSFESIPSLIFSIYDTSNSGIIGHFEVAVSLLIICGR